MDDRAHQIANRAETQRQRRQPRWRQGTGEPVSQAEDEQLSAGLERAYQQGRSGREDR